MTMTTNEDQTTTGLPEVAEQFAHLSEQIGNLRTERKEVAARLTAAGVEADRIIRADLAHAVTEARGAVQRLAVALDVAKEMRAALDARIDAGDDTVQLLEVVEADMAVRTTDGKLKPARAALQRAERALAPFLADDHLALLAVVTVADLVDVPVIIRKRAKDVEGIANAVVLRQVEATEGYGTAYVSGQVRVSEVGTTGLDRERLQQALAATGADVSTFGDVIDYERAMWPLPPLLSPSERAVEQFAENLSRQFRATLRESPKGHETYAYYETRWETVEQSLRDNGNGVATGKIVARFGVEDTRPHLSQIEQFIKRSLGYFAPDTLTSAGLLDRVELTEVVDLGPWVPESDPFIAGRQYDQQFGLAIGLTFRYQPVAPPAAED